MTEDTIYFIQQTQQQGQDVVVAGKIDHWLPAGAAMVLYRVADAWAPSMNVIPAYELPNIRFWRDRAEWEEEWARCMTEGEKLVAVEG